MDSGPFLQNEPAVVYTPQRGEYLVAYTDYAAADNAGVTLQLVADTGALGPSLSIGSSGSDNYRMTPALAYDVQANKILVSDVHVYKDGGGTWHNDVLSVLQDPDLNMWYVEETVHLGTGFNTSPAVACWPGQNYLVTWTTGFLPAPVSIYARRVGTDGVPQGPAAGFAVAACTGLTGCRDNRVAFAPDFGFVVTWNFVAPLGGISDVYGRVVRPGQDAPYDDAFDIETGDTEQEAADVACVGGASASACLVADAHCPSPGGCANFDIAGRLLGPWLTHLPVTVKD